MSHYDSFREAEYAAERREEAQSRLSVSTEALDVLDKARAKVLRSYVRYVVNQPVPSYVQDAFQIIENYHKAQLLDNQE